MKQKREQLNKTTLILLAVYFSILAGLLFVNIFNVNFEVTSFSRTFGIGTLENRDISKVVRFAYLMILFIIIASIILYNAIKKYSEKNLQNRTSFFFRKMSEMLPIAFLSVLVSFLQNPITTNAADKNHNFDVAVYFLGIYPEQYQDIVKGFSMLL